MADQGSKTMAAKPAERRTAAMGDYDYQTSPRVMKRIDVRSFPAMGPKTKARSGSHVELPVPQI